MDLEAEIKRMMEAKQAAEEASDVNEYMEQDVHDHTPEALKPYLDSNGAQVDRFKKVVKGLVRG